MRKMRKILLVMALLSLVIIGGAVLVTATKKESFAASPTHLKIGRYKLKENGLALDTNEPEKLAPDLDNPNSGDKTPELTTKIENLIQSKEFNGTLLVIKNGKVLLNKGYGYANKETNQLNTFQSLYYIGSIEKSITATAIMKLVDEEKIKLTDPIKKYYPTINDNGVITVKQLLTHTSGIVGMKKTGQQVTHNGAVQEVLDQLKIVNNGHWHYTDDDYILLAGIIERASGTDYSTYVTKNIIEKANLSHTGFYDSFDTALFHTVAYQKVGNQAYQPLPITKGSLSEEFGAGNMYMTAGDLVKFNQALVDGKLISKTSLDQMQTPGSSESSYGFGMYLGEKTKYSHGVLGGYHSLILISKDGNDGVVVMANEKTPFDILQTAGAILKEADKVETID